MTDNNSPLLTNLHPTDSDHHDHGHEDHHDHHDDDHKHHHHGHNHEHDEHHGGCNTACCPLCKIQGVADTSRAAVKRQHERLRESLRADALGISAMHRLQGAKKKLAGYAERLPGDVADTVRRLPVLFSDCLYNSYRTRWLLTTTFCIIETSEKKS